MNTNNKVRTISSRTHVRLDQWQSTILNTALLEEIIQRFPIAVLHYDDFAFFQRDGNNVRNLTEELQSDIQWYLWLVNNNLPLLKELNHTQKETVKQFNKAVPMGGMEKQETELSEVFLEFTHYVKEELQEPFIKHYKTADHTFLGYGNTPLTVKEDGVLKFRMDMPLPSSNGDIIIQFPIGQLGNPALLIKCLDELKALEHMLQTHYRKLACGVSLSDTLYHDLTPIILEHHYGKEYLMPYYDQVNTDFVSLLISMVIRLRLGIVRFLYRLSTPINPR